jgi:hypothetical protein
MTILAELESDIEIGIGDAYKVFTAIGLSPLQALSGIIGIFNGTVTPKSLLSTLVTEYQNPANVTATVKALLALPGLPGGVITTLNTLESLAAAAAANPAAVAEFVAAIDAIEKALGI